MMNNNEFDRIVEEVVRRLKCAGRQMLDDSAGGAATSFHQAEPTDRRIVQRIVTLAQLPELDSTKRLIVEQDAIVTPAVRDELHTRDIQLIRGHAAGNSPKDTLVVAIWQSSFDATELIQKVASEGILVESEKMAGGAPVDIRRRNGSPHHDAVCSVAHDSRVVVFTDSPALAVFRASTRGSARAAWICDDESLHGAIEDLDANVAVLQPTRHTMRELVELTCSFARRPSLETHNQRRNGAPR